MIRFLALFLFALVPLALVACGDDDEEDATTAPSATESDDQTDDATAAPTATESLRERWEGETLVIGGAQGTVHEHLRPIVDQAFTDLTGATIEWVEGSAPENLTKLIASRGSTPPFDAVFLDNVTKLQAIEAGVIQQVDPDNIPNMELIPENLMPNEGYGPTWLLLRLGMCYDTAAYEANGLEPPNGIDGWFDPGLGGGRFTFPDSESPIWRASMPALADHFGTPIDTPGPVIERLEEIDAVLYTSTGAVQTAFQQGDVWNAGLITDGRCLGTKLGGASTELAPLELQIDGQTYDYIGLTNSWDVTAGTDKKELAEAFINIAASPEAAAALATSPASLGSVPAMPEGLEIAQQDPTYASLVPEGFDFEGSYVPDYEGWSAAEATWIDAWNRAFR